MTVCYAAAHGGKTSVLDTWEAAAKQLAHGGTMVCAFESRAEAAAWRRPAHEEEEAETTGEAPADCTVAFSFEIDEDGTAAVGAAIAQPAGGPGWRGGRLLHGAARHDVVEVEALVHALEAARTLAGWADRVRVHGCSAALLCQLGPSASAEAAPRDAAAAPPPALESLLGRARLLLTELGEPALRPPPDVADWGALPLEEPQQLWREARALAAKALATRRSGSELLLAPELHPPPLLPAAAAPRSPPRPAVPAPTATRCASLPVGPLASFLQPAAAGTTAAGTAIGAAGTAAAEGAAEPDDPPTRGATGVGGATEAAGSVTGVRLREASAWECPACTYVHEGAEACYLACSLCGAERPEARSARPAQGSTPKSTVTPRAEPRLVSGVASGCARYPYPYPLPPYPYPYPYC